MTTALEFVRQLGLGWNLGNTFDAFPSKESMRRP